MKLLGVRLTEEETDRLEASAKTLGLDKSKLARSAIFAVVEHVESHGSLRLPIELKRNDSDPE